MLHAAAAVAQAAGAADALTQEVQLGPAGVGPADDLVLGDPRRVDREHTLHALVVDDPPHADHLVRAATLAADEHALEHLDALLVALDDAAVDIDGVAHIHARDVVLQGVGGQGLDQLLR